MLALAERGDLGGMSFGFTVTENGERWAGNRRELRSVNLVEISVVSAWPAYPDTVVLARAKTPNSEAEPRAALSGDLQVMGLLRKIADRFDPVETRRQTTWDLLAGGVDLTGLSPMNPRAAENLSTVLACVSAISSAMSSLPAYVYRQQENGRTIDSGHPISRLIDGGPNQHQTWADWR